MSSTSRFVVALLLSSIAVVPAAQAEVFRFGGTLSGAAEASPNASPGTGPVLVVFDDAADTLRVTASFAGLLGTSTAAHIHLAPPGVSGDVVTQLPSFVGFPLGVTSGNFDMTYTLAEVLRPSFVTAQGGVANASATLLAALQANGAYFNLHTSAFPGGELRADLSAVPEPATWALMIGGFGLVGGMLRRRKEVAAVA